jgi:miniconductance mechanosensitive channel
MFLLTGLGASAAILMLVFKDSIMGFVSGIQLSANKMLKVGDWIAMPKYNADGTVIEVTLNTVKVRNWDNTIITIPPYALVSDSFQNWRGMQESGGRRVKRSVNIDMNSVKFCTPEMLEKYRKIHLLRDYINITEDVVKKYNEDNSIDNSVLVNGRRQTNLGVFRAYLTQYLKNLPEVNQELTCMVRQLQPTDHGIPVELYFFSAIKEWVIYEGVQADVFDHVLAIIPEFDLSVFQSPSGADFARVLH